MAPLAAAAALALSTIAPAAAPDASGEYVFEGSCPTLNSGYRGRLTIRRNGVFYALTWRIDGTYLVGTGLINGERMVVEFQPAGGQGGLMDMAREAAGWRGTWAYYGFNEVCTETWTPA